jgi:hypothetical protein
LLILVVQAAFLAYICFRIFCFLHPTIPLFNVSFYEMYSDRQFNMGVLVLYNRRHCLTE